MLGWGILPFREHMSAIIPHITGIRVFQRYTIALQVGDAMQGIPIVQRGGNIVFHAFILDEKVLPPVPALLDLPEDTVTITLVNPSGVAIVNNVLMSPLDDGVYFFKYQTTDPTDVAGLWTAQVQVTTSSGTDKSLPVVAFLLKA